MMNLTISNALRSRIIQDGFQPMTNHGTDFLLLADPKSEDHLCRQLKAAVPDKQHDSALVAIRQFACRKRGTENRSHRIPNTLPISPKIRESEPSPQNLRNSDDALRKSGVEDTEIRRA
jgi:hypothetical protein